MQKAAGGPSKAASGAVSIKAGRDKSTAGATNKLVQVVAQGSPAKVKNAKSPGQGGRAQNLDIVL